MVSRKRAARSRRRIDVTRLPEDIVTLLDDLPPGENLVVTRDGVPIATIASMIDVVEGAIVDPDAPDEVTEQAPADYDGVTVVATAMELSTAARVALSNQLGADYVVLDMKAAPLTADVLLVPPGSPQLIGALRGMFTKARIIVTEIEDDELGVQYHGPVRRLLDAGAEAYLPPANLPRLAMQLDYTLHHGRELSGGTTTQRQIAPADDPDA
ncbi:hypothetical protein ACIBKY_28395 [Nonomuraea sp. NPDC050394]|uniref:hypothetical protein n=1 Tax=Nonomuraea sp. NPDC050394 TaxID=3364363 RepID=UPI0037927530